MTIPTSRKRLTEHALTTVPAEISDPAALRGRNRPQLRRYDVSTLLPDGTIAESRHVAPALPIFEDAFCAFSRGAMIETETGPVAVEDLLPGDRILTADGAAHPLVWKGQTTVVPGRPGVQGRNMKLMRIMPDGFGMQRPFSGVVVGPSARILQRPLVQGKMSPEQNLNNVRDFVDGDTVIETAPPAAVELFHICLPRHAVIRVAGLEFETYHPGEHAAQLLSHQMRAIFLNLFSHVSTFRDFGPLVCPRSGDDPRSALIA